MDLPNKERAMALAAGSNAFAFDLWAKAPKGNLAISPASISVALAMTYGGARGETAQQIKTVLHFGQEPHPMLRSWAGMARVLGDPARQLGVCIASQLFLDEGVRLDPVFLAETKAAFGVPEQVGFRKNPDRARESVNAWAERQTSGRIRGLLPPGSVNAQSRLVLANAICFLGRWLRPFDAAKTREEPFHTSATTSVPAWMMGQVGEHAFAELSGVKVLELDYEESAASLLVALPDAIDGLAAVEDDLGSATFKAWRRALAATRVSVHLPRFEVNPPEPLSLAETLAGMGMPIAFDAAAADLTGIAAAAHPDERLHVGGVFHKAFVRVDERGTEAAGATAVVMAPRGGPPPKPRELRADHPFLFFILDKASGLILFMGRVTQP